MSGALIGHCIRLIRQCFGDWRQLGGFMADDSDKPEGDGGLCTVKCTYVLSSYLVVYDNPFPFSLLAPEPIHFFVRLGGDTVER